MLMVCFGVLRTWWWWASPRWWGVSSGTRTSVWSRGWRTHSSTRPTASTTRTALTTRPRWELTAPGTTSLRPARRARTTTPPHRRLSETRAGGGARERRASNGKKEVRSTHSSTCSGWSSCQQRKWTWRTRDERRTTTETVSSTRDSFYSHTRGFVGGLWGACR